MAALVPALAVPPALALAPEPTTGSSTASASRAAPAWTSSVASRVRGAGWQARRALRSAQRRGLVRGRPVKWVVITQLLGSGERGQEARLG